MQDLYYNSGSGITSSLLLIKENGTPEAWVNKITNLTISGSLGEIIAYSGSSQVVSFPIDNTNLYYGVDYTQILYPPSTSLFSPPPPPPQPVIEYSSFNTIFSLVNIDPDYIITDFPGYYVSSSNVSLFLSGSNAFYQPLTASLSNTSGSFFFSLPTGSYELGIFWNGTLPGGLTSSINVYDTSLGTTLPFNRGLLVTSISSSSEIIVDISSSFFASSSRSYTAYLSIEGKYIV